LKVGGYLVRNLNPAASTSGVEAPPGDVVRLADGPPADVLESPPALDGRGSGRSIFPAVPSLPCDSALRRAFARVVCNCFVASLGSAALLMFSYL
jgi:hypothetical protein